MRLLTCRAADGLPVPVLLSAPAGDCRAAVLHVHGWGGDFCANEFVRRSHDVLPQSGIAFASVNLRTSGYLNEKYTEDSVRYVGSSVTDPSEALLDISAAVDALNELSYQVVLQGHSFGTNLVRVYASHHPELERMIFLSPSDSFALYREWAHPRMPRSEPGDQQSSSDPAGGQDEPIVWTAFGMAAGEAAYPIPIRASMPDRLLEGNVFRAWSGGGAKTSQPALVVLGGADPIAAVGLTASDEFFKRELRQPTIVRVRGARHLFAGLEDELLQVELDWLEASR